CLRPDTSGIRSLRFGSKVNLGTKNGGSCGIRTYDQLVKSQLVLLAQKAAHSDDVLIGTRSL
ncbi:hypothetical protein, partial [Pseudomonas coronafaciens]|uniref:hypothetical protein n=1 Tax=Pseudomonas coronafaciens TaxID=53409 RepID=UPI001967DD6E